MTTRKIRWRRTATSILSAIFAAVIPLSTATAVPAASLSSADLSALTEQVRPHGSKGPIRHAPVDSIIPKYFGSPATANPVDPIVVPDHPYLAEQGRNSMHGNSYSTGSYNYDAPLGINPVVTSQAYNSIGGEVANVQFDSKGRIIAVSGGFAGFRLLLLDPDSLEILAETNLPQRESTREFLKTLDFSKISSDTSGGAYFSLLEGDRPLIGNSENHIQVYHVDDTGESPKWIKDQDFDISKKLPEHSFITTVLPDYEGNYWFVTRFGQVGYLDPKSGDTHIITLKDEEIQNAFSLDENGIYIVSDHAQYSFHIGKYGNPEVQWRTAYDRGTFAKPGEIDQGSGTTPTLLDVKDTKGKVHHLLGITDNADGRVNLLIIDRDNGKVISKTPLFKDGESCTENSLIADGRSFMSENNYSPNGAGFLADDPESSPGVTRVDVDPDVKGAHVVWESQEASNTTVPKLSTKTGLVYLYTRIKDEKIPDNAVAWYLTAIDFRTGKTVYRVFTGTGKSWNNSYAPIFLSPNGALYVGVFNGLVSVRDSIAH